MHHTIQYSTALSIERDYDVVVCGGGPAGCAAALSARREGLKTLLVESSGQLGGAAVSAMVSQWLGGRTQEGNWVVGGIFKSLAEEAARQGCALIPHLDPAQAYHPFGWYNWFIHGVPLDPFRIDLFLHEKMEAAGIDVLLHTEFVDAIGDGVIISDVVLHNRSGLIGVAAKAVVDATGNAEVAFRSHCETTKGRKEDGKMAPASLIFHVYDVDEAALTRSINEKRDPKFRWLIGKLAAQGLWRFPYEIFLCTRLPQTGEFYINTIRLVGVDGTDGESLSRGMVQGKREVRELMELMRAHFPGFKDAKLKAVAPQLGIRETRRIVGDYRLSVDDLRENRDFADCIGFSMYGWDLPDPSRPSVQPFATDRVTGYTHKVEKGLSTPLPYRIMLPRPVRNLICPGRAVCVEGQVLGPVRVMGPCMAMGEAAGMAAAQVVKSRIGFADVDIAALREGLRRVGAIVDRDRLPPIHPRVDQV